MRLTINEIVILGDSEVGKTSIVNMLSGGEFSFHYKATMCFDYTDLSINSDNGLETDVRFVELSGQEVYRELINSIPLDASAVIIVVDATKQETLYTLPSWLKIVKNQGLNDNQIIFCLNKVDMIDLISITIEDLHQAILAENILPNLIISSAYTKVGFQVLLNSINNILKVQSSRINFLKTCE